MKYLLSAIGGAVAMFLVLLCLSTFAGKETPEPTEYEHIDYVSDIDQADCFLCGDGGEPLMSLYWGQDNVGILALNTFEILPVEINRYDDYGNLITTQAGYMQSGGMQPENGNVHTFTNPDDGYANVHIYGTEYEVDRNSVQKNLCQNCLDVLNSEWYSDDLPVEFAVVNFADKTIEPMLASKTGFSSGDFYVDCECKEDGKIDLLIFQTR